MIFVKNKSWTNERKKNEEEEEEEGIKRKQHTRIHTENEAEKIQISFLNKYLNLRLSWTEFPFFLSFFRTL